MFQPIDKPKLPPVVQLVAKTNHSVMEADLGNHDEDLGARRPLAGV